VLQEILIKVVVTFLSFLKYLLLRFSFVIIVVVVIV